MFSKKIFLVLIFVLSAPIVGDAALFLRDNLKQAESGDYLVTMQNKCYTFLFIEKKLDGQLKLQEITIPLIRFKQTGYSSYGWRKWAEDGAPGHTAWVMYRINLNNGEMEEFYSFTQKMAIDVARSNQFLTTLLNLPLYQVPERYRKKVGPPPPAGAPDWRRYWQPIMVSEGQPVRGINFDAWQTRWPKDGTEMSERSIMVYLPQELSEYTSYFPYWLEIRGMVGKAKVRIVDSGKGLRMDHPAMNRYTSRLYQN